jgi:hypothetical protein
MVERHIYEAYDNTLNQVEAYIIASSYESAVIKFDNFMAIEKINMSFRKLEDSDLVWVKENLAGSTYIITVLFHNEVTQEVDSQRYLISATPFSEALNMLRDHVGDNFIKIKSVDRVSSVIIN